MKFKLLLLLALQLHLLQSALATNSPVVITDDYIDFSLDYSNDSTDNSTDLNPDVFNNDSTPSQISIEPIQLSFNFEFPRTIRLKLENVVGMTDYALNNKKSVKLEIRSPFPISFDLMKCNSEVIWKKDPTNKTVIYFDEIWLQHLTEIGRRRCTKEVFDFVLDISSSDAQNGSVSFEVIERIHKRKSRKTNGPVIVEFDQKAKQSIRYAINFPEEYYTVSHSSESLLLILPVIPSKTMSLKFSKCGMNQIFLDVTGTDFTTLASRFISEMVLLKNVYCDEDLHEDSFDLTIRSETELTGSLVFELVPHNTSISSWIFVLVLTATFIPLSIVGYILYASHRRNAARELAIRRRHFLANRPLPLLPYQSSDYIPMVNFVRNVPSYEEEHIYEEID